MHSEFDISGKTVIITGAARGIGRGIVEVLAEAGARVMVTALTDRYLKPLQDRMASKDLPIDILVADATDSSDWQRTVETALDNWGHIDVLINNLGDAIEGYLVPPPDSDDKAPLTEAEWRSVVDINLTEAFLGCQTIAEHFVSRRAGKVINISGYAARKGNPGFPGVLNGQGRRRAPYPDPRPGVGTVRHNRQLHRPRFIPRPRSGNR